MKIFISKEPDDASETLDVWNLDDHIPIRQYDGDVRYVIHPKCKSEEIAMTNRILEELYLAEIEGCEIVLDNLHFSSVADAVTERLVLEHSNIFRTVTGKISNIFKKLSKSFRFSVLSDRVSK